MKLIDLVEAAPFINHPGLLTELKDIENWLNKHGVKNYIIGKNNIVHVRGDVNLEKRSIDYILVKFGVVEGYFDISNNKLKTLLGSPTVVEQSFQCKNNVLQSLEGGPKEVGVDYDCSYNLLTTLTGAPRELMGYRFDCGYNKLTNLEGSPRKVNIINATGNPFTSLKGAPNEIDILKIVVRYNSNDRHWTIRDLPKTTKINTLQTTW